MIVFFLSLALKKDIFPFLFYSYIAVWFFHMNNSISLAILIIYFLSVIWYNIRLERKVSINSLGDLNYLFLIVFGVFITGLYNFSNYDSAISSVKTGIIFIVYLMSFFFIYKLIRPETFYRHILYYLTSGIIFLFTLFWFAYHYPPWLQNRLSVAGYIHPNQLSMLLELFYPIPLFLSLQTRKPLYRILFVILSLLFIGSLLFTYSRAGLITLIICCGFLILRRLNIKTFLFICFLISLLSTVYFKGFQQRNSIKSIDNIISAGTRLKLQQTGITMALNHYLFFGYGINKFKDAKYSFGFPRYLDPEGVMSIHNFYFELLLGIGLLGFIGFYGFCLKILIGLYRLKSAELNTLRLGLFFCIISFLIHSFFDCSIAPGYLMLISCILAFSRFLINNHDNLTKPFWA